MPIPDASPTPPPFGIYGEPLILLDKDQAKEPTDDGGYDLWRLEDVNGEKRWMPFKHVGPKIGIEV